MALAKLEGMDEEEFYRTAKSVANWVTPLNPYEHKGPLFKIEDVNDGLDRSEIADKPAPLFILAISDKRYALFNIDANGKPIIRKASAHGLGHLLSPYVENAAPASIPSPAVGLDKIGVERWHHDLWYQIILAALEGHPDTVELDYHLALDNPAASRYSATTPALLRWFKTYNVGKPRDQQVWPFNFMLAYQVSGHRHAMGSVDDIESTKLSRKRTNTVSPPKPVAPYDIDTSRAAQKCFDRESGEPFSVDLLMTCQEALAQYHLHPESKFLNGDAFDRGRTHRRRIEAIAINCIGKEANRWEEQYYLGLSSEAQIEYGVATKDVAGLQRTLAESGLSLREIAKHAPVSRPTLAKLLRGEPARDADEIIGRMMKAIREITKEP